MKLMIVFLIVVITILGTYIAFSKGYNRKIIYFGSIVIINLMVLLIDFISVGFSSFSRWAIGAHIILTFWILIGTSVSHIFFKYFRSRSKGSE